MTILGVFRLQSIEDESGIAQHLEPQVRTRLLKDSAAWAVVPNSVANISVATGFNFISNAPVTTVMSKMKVPLKYRNLREMLNYADLAVLADSRNPYRSQFR